jgi:predicted RNase H-like nuclease
LLLDHIADLGQWPVATREGDLADLDEAAAIDAVACAILARRCLGAAGDRWAVIGDAARGRIALAACPEMIGRADVNIARLRAEGTIAISPEVAGSDLGPPQSW